MYFHREGVIKIMPSECVFSFFVCALDQGPAVKEVIIKWLWITLGRYVLGNLKFF